MSQASVCLLFSLLSLHHATALDSTRGRRSTSNSTTITTSQQVADNVRHRVDGHFVKPQNKKPILPGVGENPVINSSRVSPQRQVHVASTVDRVRNLRPRPSTSVGSHSNDRPATCSPSLYLVPLQNGNCSRTVRTKMCYGECTSYTFPRRSRFSNIGEALRSVDSSCMCCSAVQMSTRRHDVLCYVDARGRGTIKTFYVPFSESCTCRPCRRY